MPYTEITESEMDDFLLGKGFKEVDLDGVREKVYGYRFSVDGNPFTLRVYSTIDERTGVSRDCGNDAIRVEIYKWDYDAGEPVHVGHSKKVLRIETWKKNLGKRLKNVKEMFGPKCPSCASMMVRRSGSNGDFWGCSKYHVTDCSGTRNID